MGFVYSVRSQRSNFRLRKLFCIGQYYLHTFADFQPDENNKTAEAMAIKDGHVHIYIDAGVTVAYATDYPAGPIIFPFVNLPAGVNRQHLDLESTIRNVKEGLTIDQALKAMTITGAYQMGREDETGSLEVGKYADFIVLNQDLTAIDPHDICVTKYEAVYTTEGENVLSEGGK